MITATINMGPLIAKLNRLGGVIKQPMHEMVRTQARLFVSSSGKVPGMIQSTPPFSAKTTQAKARKQGEEKIRRDIRRVYGLPSDLYAKIKNRDPKLAAAFWGMVINQDWEKASKLSQRITGYRMVEFDGGAAHQRLRDKSDGTVHKQQPVIFLRDPVGKAGELDKYIKQVQARVGILASGFNAAASSLGAKGVPPWVTRHGTRFSGISVQEGANSFFITISDKVPFGEKDTIYRMRYVLGYLSNSLDRQMPHLIRKAIKDAGLAATGATLT